VDDPDVGIGCHAESCVPSRCRFLLTLDLVRIFYIPSWWPHRHGPVVGVFTLEQILATAELRPDWGLAVVNWGQGEHVLALRKPGEWRTRLAAYRCARAERVELRPNLIEYRRRALTWAYQIAGGNLRSVVRSAHSALEGASADLGGIDLIHAHVSFPAGFVAMRLRAVTGIPYVVSEHWHYPPRLFLRRDGAIDRRVLAPLLAADAVIAVSSAQARDMADCGSPEPQVVPPAVDEREFGLAAPVVRGGPVVFLSVTNMVDGKGVDDLLLALHRLAPADRDGLELRLGGTGPALDRYKALAEELGVTACVRWLGLLSRERVREEMQACDYFVLPSRKESFGVVYAEAQACGKPVIAARAGGPEDIVSPETAILIEPGDVTQLVGALQAAIRSRGEWDAVAIRERFLRSFSRSVVVDKLESVYRRVLSST
jgi:glycosyltransferase involved in cell wall biosynthesis